MTARQTSLGRWTLTALVVANMIGAGVFTTSGFALADLGSPLRVLAAWLIGGGIALCGAVSYGALARLIPGSAGEYLYLSRAIHPAAGFVAGWLSLLAGFTAAIAYAARTFAAYAMPEGGDSPAASVVATLVIAMAVLLHARQVRLGARVQNVVVGLKLLLITGFCVWAVAGPGISAWQGLGEIRGAARSVPEFEIANFALSLMWISFSYSGFNAAVYIAGEVPGARERIPSALVTGTLITATAYIALNAVFVLAPPFAAAAGQADIAAVTATAIGGKPLALAIRIIIALALLTSVSAMVMIGPRVYARMADDGLFPSALRFRGDAPLAAIVTQGVLATAVVWIAGLRELLSYLGFALGLGAAATVASLFIAARRNPGSARDLPGYPWAPAIFVLFTLVFAGLAATVNPREMLAALATLASGLLLYAIARNFGSGVN